MKHYHDGTRISDEVMGGANPLLVVHGNLTEDGRTAPPPSPEKRSRPIVIDGNHMVCTGRVDTRPFFM